MSTHFDHLSISPLPALLAWGNPALTYFVRRDLLGEAVPPVRALGELPEAARLVRKQQPDGSWRYPGKGDTSLHGTNYDLLETYRNLRVLVEMYGFDRESPVIRNAADYVFACQTEAGEIRGILGNQSMPYYHGAILAVLVRAGLADDPRLRKGLDWLLTVRQLDGGWIAPAQGLPPKQKTPQFWTGPTLPPDRRLPSSHLITDMALRPFACHPAYRDHPAVRQAAEFLKGRLFKADAYHDRKGPEYWLKFQYPFWWHNLVASLDSLGRLGFPAGDEAIARGLDWFVQHQSPDGLWETGYGSGRKAEGMRHWVGLAVGKMLNLF